MSAYDEALARRTEVDRMYDVADDYEAATLDELRRRAGITWECYRGDPDRLSSCWTNMADDEVCQQCGTPRPAAEQEATE